MMHNAFITKQIFCKHGLLPSIANCATFKFNKVFFSSYVKHDK